MPSTVGSWLEYNMSPSHRRPTHTTQTGLGFEMCVSPILCHSEFLISELPLSVCCALVGPESGAVLRDPPRAPVCVLRLPLTRGCGGMAAL